MDINDPRFSWMKNPENTKGLYLMRGCPSSGKSYYAKQLAGDDLSVICSADHFFGETVEEYVKNWQFEKLSEAHKSCQKKAKIAMQRQSPLVIVDNGNYMISDIMPYFEMAFQYQYRFEMKEPVSDWWINDIAPYLNNKEKNRAHLEKMCELLWKKNQETHCVPLKSIQKMLFRYQVLTFDDLARAAR
jgi:tRNA uridine 5-carbamoylmethylation protein Kti12